MQGVDDSKLYEVLMRRPRPRFGCELDGGFHFGNASFFGRGQLLSSGSVSDDLSAHLRRQAVENRPPKVTGGVILNKSKSFLNMNSTGAPTAKYYKIFNNVLIICITVTILRRNTSLDKTSTSAFYDVNLLYWIRAAHAQMFPDIPFPFTLIPFAVAGDKPEKNGYNHS